MKLPLFLIICCMTFGLKCYSQELYSARGYWEESIKPNYQSIKQRQNNGDSLNVNQAAYIKDYETYLATYFQRLTEEEKQKFEVMKDQWNHELVVKVVPPGDNNSFEWRTRDRFITAAYGTYYGISLVALAGIDDNVGAGVPLLIGGLMLLGPAMNPKKYEGITQNTIRANNTGRLLGLGYGAALGLAIGGADSKSYKLELALSSIGSMALGEVAFQQQKKKNISRGQIEIMRHYGILFPLIGVSLISAAQFDSPNIAGLALLGGGVTGLLVGNKVSKKYDYSQGDVNAINSFAIISAGLGITLVAESLDNNSDNNALILIPAATSIIGTVISQRAVKGVHLSTKQGSTISLSTAGAILVGFGVAAVTGTESAVVVIGVPTLCALVTHKLLFNKFKMQNLEMNFKGSEKRKHDYKFSFNVSPENYLLNKKIPVQGYPSPPQLFSRSQSSLFNIRFTF